MKSRIASNMLFNIFYTNYVIEEIDHVYTLKEPNATCGEWRQGWTTLCRNFLEVRNSIFLKFFYLVFWIFKSSSTVLLLRKFTQNMIVMLVFNVFRSFCLLRDWMCGIFNIFYLWNIILEMRTSKKWRQRCFRAIKIIQNIFRYLSGLPCDILPSKHWLFKTLGLDMPLNLGSYVQKH